MKSTTLSKSVLTIFTAIALLSMGNTAAGAWFQGLGRFPGGRYVSAHPRISAAGTTVAGIGSSASGTEAFCWTRAGGMVGLGDLPGGQFSSRAFNISADGSTIVGWSASASGGEAFRWTARDGMVGLGDIPGGTFASVATGVSADGSVVAGLGNNGTVGSGPQVFRWTQASGMVSLGSGRGEALSEDGTTIVGWHGRTGFRWTETAGVVADLAFMPTATSRNASVIVGVDLAGNEAIRWTASDGAVGLGALLPRLKFQSHAAAVSADGSVVVGWSIVSKASGNSWNFGAFIWDEANGMRKLEDLLTARGINFDGWRLRMATGVSADGLVIVGNGTNPDGQSEGWIVSLRDEEPPVIAEAAPSSNTLWPPNNKMQSIALDAVVTDDSGEAVWGVVGVECSDPGAENDIQIVDDHTVDLRATRSAQGAGRVYTIWLQASDAAGNLSAPFPVEVVVPHDQGRNSDP